MFAKNAAGLWEYKWCSKEERKEKFKVDKYKKFDPFFCLQCGVDATGSREDPPAFVFRGGGMEGGICRFSTADRRKGRENKTRWSAVFYFPH